VQSTLVRTVLVNTPSGSLARSYLLHGVNPSLPPSPFPSVIFFFRVQRNEVGAQEFHYHLVSGVSPFKDYFFFPLPEPQDPPYTVPFSPSSECRSSPPLSLPFLLRSSYPESFLGTLRCSTQTLWSFNKKNFYPFIFLPPHEVFCLLRILAHSLFTGIPSLLQTLDICRPNCTKPNFARSPPFR